ncbi:ABC transporter ATP-binding protein [Psychroflexus gondwanensis]|jgi:ATP-binding cassette subfamily B protein|uniref:Multidrug ABC-type exporter, ATP-binding/permease components n=1 Tax=Psychroflexus gondwanensis ACAM 44 TaxID=1189619 RepID=N1X0E2_9FLAO|nr:ABC transporter ATP-binding protein [Psychroflexus gondwanensis]EMY81478.1 multidrug ABC-type exporter, ATP-binding/permease components [Psychroflexus gondwanensis ACAM 44]TXE21049.1 ABC transporter ATP-binding protein [Psychroflexus gondwanensis]
MARASENKNDFASLRFIPRFLSRVYHTHPGLFIGNVFLRLLKSLIPITLLWVGKEIIDEVILQVDLDPSDLTRLYWLIGIELLLAILSDVFNRLISLTDGLLGDLYSNTSSIELIQKTAKVELASLEDSEFYDKLERARQQTTSRVSLMSNVLAQIQDIITIISLVSGLIYFYPILILLLVISIIPSFINELKYSQSSYSLQKSWTPERRELDYMRMIGASDVTAKEIKLFGLADFISSTFKRISDKYYKANKKLSIKKSLWGGVFHILGDLAYYGAYVFIVLKAVAGLVTIGDLTFLAGSFSQLRNQLQTVFSRFSNITQSAMYLQDYFEFIDMDFSSDNPEQYREAPSEFNHSIQFENVSFSYPQSEKMVLSSLTFDLKKGEKLALVGENGAGKTTLIKLLLRLYEPTGGQILMDGVPIREYRKEDYQKMLGAIFQDFVKYYLTAKINIAVGNIDEQHNSEKIKDAAVQSLANDVIESLPMGYDQGLGRRFKKGAELSGGQWQKIALARAYMSDAPIIILDEPTSALDARAESEVFQRFIGLTKDRTSIIISHRFSTVRMADRILVLQNGSILELGTHEELLAKPKLYAELFELQAEGYRE